MRGRDCGGCFGSAWTGRRTLGPDALPSIIRIVLPLAETIERVVIDLAVLDGYRKVAEAGLLQVPDTACVCDRL